MKSETYKSLVAYSSAAAFVFAWMLFLDSRFLSATDCNENSFTEAVFTGHVTSDNVRMREKPCVNSKSRGFLKIGTPIFCTKKSKDTEQIGNTKSNWFFCGLECDQGGWIYGSFVKEGKFNTDAHLRTLPEVKQYPASFKKLLKTNWSDCNPNEEANRGCGGLTIDGKTITIGVIEIDTYQIKEITERGGKLYVKADLLFSNSLVETSSVKSEFVISFDKSDSIILVDDKEFYK